QHLLHRALEIGEKVYSNHPNLAILYANLGSVETERPSGDLGQARKLFHRAIQIGSNILGPDHPTMGAVYSGLSTVEQRSGHLDVARGLLEHSIRIGEPSYGCDNPEVAVWYANMGTVEDSAGNREEASQWLRRAHAVFLGRFGARDPRTLQVLEKLRRIDPDFNG
ncbi:MAG: tetratricopeptide repeat protein, partial [Bryobacteraceae bacterium]|nr:tetratricopeptide repeat protein [Bryobacteraceae bacterium]